MCEPTTIVMVAGLVLGAVGAVQQNNAGKAAAQAQEEQAEENAKFAEAQATNATMTGLVEEDRRRAQTRAMLAKQRTAMAANNVDMSTGTPLELLGDTAAIGEQDALTIRANAAREAWGYRSQGVNYKNHGAAGVAAAKNQGRATLLTTAGNMAQQGYGFAGSRGANTGIGPVVRQPITG
jgi:hypothetical protein